MISHMRFHASPKFGLERRGGHLPPPGHCSAAPVAAPVAALGAQLTLRALPGGPLASRYHRGLAWSASGEDGTLRYRALGNSGLIVSVAGLGCNNFGGRLDTGGTRAVVDAAIEAGITLLDTADSYGGGGRSEEMLGEMLTGRRDQVVLATKFGHQSADLGYGPAAGAKGGRAYIRRAAEQLAAPAADRLHRSLPAAHAGPGDADRGDAHRARRAGGRGEGPLHRALQLLRLAARRGGRRGP